MPPNISSSEWLLFSTERLILQIDENISVVRGSNSLGQNTMIVSNISKESVSKLLFLTNTDYNNNVLSLNDMSIFRPGYTNSLVIPGFSEIAINLFNQADMNAFTNYVSTSSEYKTFSPFNINSTSEYEDFNDFVSKLTILLPFTPSLLNSEIWTYQIVLIIS
jgi:hypothetical protein